MDLDKLVADVRESISAVSDDRRIDDRYITHLINIGRAEFVKKLLSQRPGYDATNLEQNWHAHVASYSRSIFPGVNMTCQILRSVEPIPKLLDNEILSRNFKVRTADILVDTIEVISAERANNITFEFNTTYAFLDYEHYLYLISKDNHQELRYAVVTGIFENPEDVDDTLTDYPLPAFMWPTIKEDIVRQLLLRPMEDPINNSEPDYIPNESAKERGAKK